MQDSSPDAERSRTERVKLTLPTRRFDDPARDSLRHAGLEPPIANELEISRNAFFPKPWSVATQRQSGRSIVQASPLIAA